MNPFQLYLALTDAKMRRHRINHTQPMPLLAQLAVILASQTQIRNQQAVPLYRKKRPPNANSQEHSSLRYQPTCEVRRPPPGPAL